MLFMRLLLIVLGSALLVGSIAGMAVAPLDDTPFKLLGAAIGVILLVAGLTRSQMRGRRKKRERRG